MKIIIYLIKKLINHLSGCGLAIHCQNYDNYYPREKKGSDFKGNFHISKKATLHYDLFTWYAHQFLVIYIKSKFLFFSFSYLEYIIDFNGTRYADNLISADQACTEICKALGHVVTLNLHEVNIDKMFRFVGPRGSFDFLMGPGDYRYFVYDKA